MKTIKTANGSVIRLSDEGAAKMVDNIDYFYCPKSEWKVIRDEEIAKKKNK